MTVSVSVLSVLSVARVLLRGRHPGFRGHERFERRAHLADRAEDAVLGRVRLEPERSADVLDRVAFEVPQDEGRPLALAERGHRRVDAILNFGTQHESLRCVLPALFASLLAAHGFEVRRVVPCFLVRPRPNQVDRAIHGDAMQPGPEVRPRLESAQLLVGLEKRLLDDVLGVRGIARHPVRQPIDSPAVALDERPERVAISVPRQRDGGDLRLRHPIA